MKKHSFTIIASGLDPIADNFEDRFFEAGCDDATVSFQNGSIILEFARSAKSFAHALLSAIANVIAAGATVEHIEPDYFVSLSEIANRAGITRSAVHNFAHGKRGSNFPAPIARVTSESPLWDWVSVARWMYRRRTLSLAVVVEAQLVKEANLALEHEVVVENFPFARRVREQIATHDHDQLACA